MNFKSTLALVFVSIGTLLHSQSLEMKEAWIFDVDDGLNCFSFAMGTNIKGNYQEKEKQFNLFGDLMYDKTQKGPFFSSTKKGDTTVKKLDETNFSQVKSPTPLGLNFYQSVELGKIYLIKTSNLKFAIAMPVEFRSNQQQLKILYKYQPNGTTTF